MNWFLWFLVGWWLFSAVVTVAQVGKPRKPLAASTAAGVVVIDTLFIAGMFLVGAR